MVANIADAISSYGKAAGLPKIGGMDDAAAGGTSFGDMLKQATQNLAETQTKAEQVGMQAAAGKANMVEVMTAMNNAQVTLQTVIACRDGFVNAMKTIMQMAA